MLPIFIFSFTKWTRMVKPTTQNVIIKNGKTTGVTV